MNLQHQQIPALCESLKLPFVAQGYGAIMYEQTSAQRWPFNMCYQCSGQNHTSLASQ
jgi:hypothetical protein